MTSPPPLRYHASDGPAYEIFLGRWTKVLAPAFLDFARIPGEGSVLDVGCGTGSLAAEVARRTPEREVIGLDVAEPYIAYARQQHGGSNLRFECADAADL